jgi:predicted phosphohydrolase
MIIQYASDLHIEFPENKEFLKVNSVQSNGDVLILAGDIVPFTILDKHDDFFSYLSDNFKLTYWIPGNHEYYGYDAGLKSGTFTEKIKNNVFLCNNTSVIIEDIKFVFSTLWTAISDAYRWQIEKSLNDFRVIQYNNYRLSAGQYNLMHDECLKFVTSELEQKSNEKIVVVTHHVPTFKNYPEEFSGDALNEAFAVELYNMIQTTQPDCWIYGHSHNNTPAFPISKTRMLTNQLGYVKYGEHKNFNNKVKINL